MIKQIKFLLTSLLLVSFLSGCNSSSSELTTSTSTSSIGPSTSTSDVEPIHVSGVSLDITNKSIFEEDSFVLNATVSPIDATDKSLSWTTFNDKVQLSSTTGESVTVTGVKEGLTSVTVTSNDGNFEATCAIEVKKVPVINKIKMYIHDQKSLIDAVEEKINDNYVAITDTGVEESVLYYNVDLNRNVRIHLSANGYFTPTGLTVNGEDKSLDENGYVGFVITTDDFDFYSLTPLYKDDTPSTGDITFDVSETTHLTLEIYDNSSLNHKINSANAGDLVYLKVIADEDNYYAREVIYTRITNDMGNRYDYNATYDSILGLFKFTVPSSFTNIVYIRMVEGDNDLLKDSDLVGTYLTLWLTTSTKKITSLEDKKNLVVSTNGSIVRYNGQTVIRSDQVKTYSETEFYTESYHTIPYGENYIFTSDRGSDSFYDPSFVNYDLLCIKKQDEADLDSIYSVDGEMLTVNSKKYVVLRVYRNDVEYINFFLDYTNKTITPNVTFKMIYGNKLSDDKVMYEVSKDSTSLLAISYINEGGTSNRIELVSPYGVYIGEKGEFILANDIVGVFEGVAMIAVLDGNTVTLSNASRRVVLTLDSSAFTYAIVSDEEVEAHVPDLRNKVFTCNFYVDWDGSNFNLLFTFNNYTSDDEIQVTFSGYMTYKATFDVTYDLDTNVMTMTLINSSQSYNWITTEGYQISALMANNKMTMQKDLNNVLNFKNAVFNCADFTL